jgi:hypothetical protein
MTTIQHTPTDQMAARAVPDRSAVDRGYRRRRAMIATAVLALGSIALLIDLLLVGHTDGEQIWGPVTAALAAAVAAMSLGYLWLRMRSRFGRVALIGLWLLVAFFGFGGYNDHRAVTQGSADSRPRPPLAPLVFTGFGLAGAFSLRYGAKGA